MVAQLLAFKELLIRIMRLLKDQRQKCAQQYSMKHKSTNIMSI